MRRPWRCGPARNRAPLAVAAVVVLSLGWVFGTRSLAIWRTAAELAQLRAGEQRVAEEIQCLQRRLSEAALPAVVEREARSKLRWGYPNEERIVILRR